MKPAQRIQWTCTCMCFVRKCDTMMGFDYCWGGRNKKKHAAKMIRNAWDMINVILACLLSTFLFQLALLSAISNMGCCDKRCIFCAYVFFMSLLLLFVWTSSKCVFCRCVCNIMSLFFSRRLYMHYGNEIDAIHPHVWLLPKRNMEWGEEWAL